METGENEGKSPALWVKGFYFVLKVGYDEDEIQALFDRIEERGAFVVTHPKNVSGALEILIPTYQGRDLYIDALVACDSVDTVLSCVPTVAKKFKPY